MKALAVLALGLALGGCQTTQEAVGRASSHGCVIASYYSHGTRTASGERFNPYGMTAAHRTLRFGTRLHVRNPRNGKSVTVIINDRGPFIRGRSLDLTLGAARRIRLNGVGRVCLS